MKALAIRIGSAVLVFSAISAAPAVGQVDVHVRGRVGVRVGTVRGEVVVNAPYRRVPHRRHAYDERRGRRYSDRNARYCNDGYGHPRGWGWCVEEGYLQPHYRLGRWVAEYDGHLVFRHRERARGHHRGHLHGRDLIRVIGRRGFERLHDHSHRIGVYGTLSGEWVYLSNGAVALGVFAGNRPVAELRDQNHDGYVDVIFLRAVRR